MADWTPPTARPTGIAYFAIFSRMAAIARVNVFMCFHELRSRETDIQQTLFQRPELWLANCCRRAGPQLLPLLLREWLSNLTSTTWQHSIKLCLLIKWYFVYMQICAKRLKCYQYPGFMAHVIFSDSVGSLHRLSAFRRQSIRETWSISSKVMTKVLWWIRLLWSANIGYVSGKWTTACQTKKELLINDRKVIMTIKMNLFLFPLPT